MIVLDISIPCENCHGPVRFGQKQCAKCGQRVSRSARAALDDRLAASSADYRELQEHVSAARTVLLIIAMAYAGWGSIGFALYRNSAFKSSETDLTARAALLENVLIAIVLLVCWQAARRAPVTAILTATVLWLGVQAVSALVVSLSIFAGWWLKSVALILLVRGAIAALRARAVQRRLTQAAGA